MKVRIVTMFVLGLSSLFLQAQTFPYTITLEPFTISGLPGLHSFVAGHDAGKWVLIGGRTDGMHRGGGGPSNPAFPVVNSNTTIYVVDPVAQQVWSASLTSLPTALQEQLQSTNMCFYQDGNWLYVAGGYGYSATAGDHVTYDKLTAIHVPNLITHIINGTSITGDFLQTTHSGMQTAGGALGKIGNTFYLFGGIDFQGRYIMGGNGGGATGSMQYTDEIRTFEIVNNGSSLSISNYTVYTNTAEYHRRDFNLVPQIFPGDVYGYMWSSGVFKAPNDEVYFNPIEITASGITVIPEATFMQKYSNYHSSKIALYDSGTQDMYSIFFGGIAQFYFDGNGNEVEDTNVPFVKTISLVSRDQNGVYAESVFSTEMPTYLGAGSEFFREESIVEYATGIVDMTQLPATTPFTVGYIYGGIESTVANSFPNNTAATSASATIYRVKFDLTAMPVELTDFYLWAEDKADCAKERITLRWHTASEQNTRHFVIERGRFGNFTPIAVVEAAGNSQTEQVYTYEDTQLEDGTMYYRLKIVDEDGSFSYSSIRSIPVCKNGRITISPNPTQGNVFITGLDVSSSTLELTDAQGRTWPVRVSHTNNGLVLDLAKLPVGVYLLQLDNDWTERIVKQ